MATVRVLCSASGHCRVSPLRPGGERRSPASGALYVARSAPPRACAQLVHRYTALYTTSWHHYILSSCRLLSLAIAATTLCVCRGSCKLRERDFFAVYLYKYSAGRGVRDSIKRVYILQCVSRFQEKAALISTRAISTESFSKRERERERERVRRCRCGCVAYSASPEERERERERERARPSCARPRGDMVDRRWWTRGHGLRDLDEVSLLRAYILYVHYTTSLIYKEMVDVIYNVAADGPWKLQVKA